MTRANVKLMLKQPQNTISYMINLIYYEFLFNVCSKVLTFRLVDV